MIRTLFSQKIWTCTIIRFQDGREAFLFMPAHFRISPLSFFFLPGTVYLMRTTLGIVTKSLSICSFWDMETQSEHCILPFVSGLKEGMATASRAKTFCMIEHFCGWRLSFQYLSLFAHALVVVLSMARSVDAHLSTSSGC